jgi:hypothetical protein
MVDKKNSRETKKGKSKKTPSLPIEDPRTLKNSDDEIDYKKSSWISSINTSFIVALLLFSTIFLSRFLQNLPVNQIPTTTDYPYPNTNTQQPSTATDQEDNTPNSITTTTPSPVYYPSPIVGSGGHNLPQDFMVGQWYDNNCEYPDYLYVKIYGVEIYGGTPPYTFTFWQNGERIFYYTGAPDNQQATHLQFPDQIIVERGVYVHVSISFLTESGVAEWVDDLLYPTNPVCPGD